MTTSDLSKEAQLRGGSDQARRRAERAGKRYKPGERNGPVDEQELLTWDEATARARNLSATLGNIYGGRWYSTCEQVGAVLYETGVINTREVTGRNALAVALLAQAWIEDGNRRAQ